MFLSKRTVHFQKDIVNGHFIVPHPHSSTIHVTLVRDWYSVSTVLLAPRACNQTKIWHLYSRAVCEIDREICGVCGLGLRYACLARIMHAKCTRFCIDIWWIKLVLSEPNVWVNIQFSSVGTQNRGFFRSDKPRSCLNRIPVSNSGRDWFAYAGTMPQTSSARGICRVTSNPPRLTHVEVMPPDLPGPQSRTHS